MLFSLLGAMLQVALIAVFLTYVLRLYEWSSLSASQKGDGEERLAPWLAGTIAMLWEYLCSLFQIALMPAGWLQNEPSKGSGLDARPIVFVSGLFANDGVFIPMKRFFRRRGHTAMFSVNLGPSNASLRHFANLIAERVDEALAATGRSQTDLICYGIGGVAARVYLKNGGAAKVANLITIGAPHQGSRLAAMLGGRSNNEVRPDADPIVRLGAESQSELALGTRYVNIYSTYDNVVLPPLNAILPGAENHRLEYLGHAALLFSTQVNTICGRVVDGLPTSKPGTPFSTEFPNG